jgi:hypothetical protein
MIRMELCTEEQNGSRPVLNTLSNISVEDAFLQLSLAEML